MKKVKTLVVMSGGMDSTIAARMAIQIIGQDLVGAISFNYGQKQKIEIEYASRSCKVLGIPHEIIDLAGLGKISRGFSANVDEDIPVPTMDEVLGDPQPITYVPNRNMTMLSMAAAYAEVNNYSQILVGFQVHDEYGYYDTTQEFVDKINSVFNLNRQHPIEVVAPFSEMSKTDELKELYKMDNSYDLCEHTVTCYNPEIGLIFVNKKSQKVAISCGVCPSCTERLNAFKNVGVTDPIRYK